MGKRRRQRVKANISRWACENKRINRHLLLLKKTADELCDIFKCPCGKK